MSSLLLLLLFHSRTEENSREREREETDDQHQSPTHSVTNKSPLYRRCRQLIDVVINSCSSAESRQ